MYTTNLKKKRKLEMTSGDVMCKKSIETKAHHIPTITNDVRIKHRSLKCLFNLDVWFMFRRYSVVEFNEEMIQK